MWAIRSQTRLLYANSLSYLVGNKRNDSRAHEEWQSYKRKRRVPCDQLDEVVVEGDASTSIKDGGVGVAIEVCGHNLREKRDRAIKHQDFSV